MSFKGSNEDFGASFNAVEDEFSLKEFKKTISGFLGALKE